MPHHSQPSAPMPLEDRLAAFRVGALRRVPFYGTLALHARYVASDAIPIAATDGYTILLNRERMEAMPREEFEFVVLHEVLHCALRHIPRRGPRDPLTWNIATDCIINELCVEVERLSPPDGLIRSRNLADRLGRGPNEPPLHTLAAEELYALLQRAAPADRPSQGQGASGQGEGESKGDGGDPASPYPHRRAPTPEKAPAPAMHPEGELRDLDPETVAREAGDAGGDPGEDGASAAPRTTAEMERHWRDATAAAAVAQRHHESRRPGSTPGGAERLMEALDEPTVDWRTLLWNHLTRHPTDYTGIDRRFVQDGLYLDVLEGEHLDVYVCIDTSSSISSDDLDAFASELGGILATHTHVRAQLYYCDTELHGPHEIERLGDAPPPTGGGGTRFAPFFERLAETVAPHDDAVAVYLTDGYAAFPDEEPDVDTIWAVTPGGAEDEAFPFGTVARIRLDGE